MHLFLWLASLEKVRKDELIGFLDIVVPEHVHTLVSELEQLIVDGLVEVITYQKLRLARGGTYNLSAAVSSISQFGIPPLQLIAFLHNQGVRDVSDINDEIDVQKNSGLIRVTPAGMLQGPILGGYTDSPWYRKMRDNLEMKSSA